MPKIKVRNPVVEMDGDEMTRITWHKIRKTMILPYLTTDLFMDAIDTEMKRRMNR